MKQALAVLDDEKKIDGQWTDFYLNAACQNSSIIAGTIEKYGELRLQKYLQNVLVHSPVRLQPLTDFLEVVHRETTKLLSADVAAQLCNTLHTRPVVLTANHHGIDYFAQSVQGSLLFGLAHKTCTPPCRAALVLACGNIPLDNITYPQGVLLYGIASKKLSDIPKKLPLFSNKLRRWSVGVAPRFDEGMLTRARKRANDLLKSELVSEPVYNALIDVLGNIYADQEILNLSTYSKQAVRANYRLWQNSLSKETGMPNLVSLELETVVNGILQKDLLNEKSLAWNALFNRNLRGRLVAELNGNRACWKYDAEEENEQCVHPSNGSSRVGTHFFWGVNRKGRRFPMWIDDEKERLIGSENGGSNDSRVELQLAPEMLLRSLESNKIVPSLFTCFLVLSFARGVNCIGGYYQADYLSQMQSGLVRALQQCTGFQSTAKIVEEVPTDSYLSGMQTVMTKSAQNKILPAGPIEILAGGGLTNEDIERILNLTVTEAHKASLFETIPDIAPGEIETEDWALQLAEDCWRTLSTKVVIK